MNWFKENKFLAGWMVVVLIGALVLGYLLMGAMSRHAEASTSYEERSQELSTLERQQPYPSARSLQALEDQRKNFEARINDLQKTLAAVELPVEPMTREQFQDRLRAAVTTFTEKAGAANVKLPDGFYMGFNRYQTEPPNPEAAGPLGRQLKAIEIVLNQAVDARVAELRKLEREPLPEEKSDNPKATVDTGKGGKGKGEKVERERVLKYPFELVVFSEPQALQKLLNNIVTAKNQFFIVRKLTVKNEKDKGPPRVDPTAQAVAVPAAPSAPGAAPSKPQTFIVGEERLETSLILEIADFAEVASAATK